MLEELTTNTESVRIIGRLRLIIGALCFILASTVALLLSEWGAPGFAATLPFMSVVVLLLIARQFNVIGPKVINGKRLGGVARSRKKVDLALIRNGPKWVRVLSALTWPMTTVAWGAVVVEVMVGLPAGVLSSALLLYVLILLSTDIWLMRQRSASENGSAN